MAALDLGPAHMPAGLFADTLERALLGMRVHANTVSHARLIALEDTFPRTRALLGHEKFNERSRQFLDWPGATTRPLAQIGQGFPAYLRSVGEPDATTELAVFEWAWLTTYHAAEAVALKLGDLAGLDETDLLGVVVARHPAANIGLVCDGLRALLGEEIPGLPESEALLLTRPDAEVYAHPATAAMWWTMARLEEPNSIGNLFASATEPDRKDQPSPDDFMPALLALIEAGALQRVG
ncbi:MAG: putative DNA-binding domain-containing protein [Betaproteobacteria bacterium]|nr:putative DNA-binding domain-containing protein [Betaproteobacteria bacterium]